MIPYQLKTLQLLLLLVMTIINWKIKWPLCFILGTMDFTSNPILHNHNVFFYYFQGEVAQSMLIAGSLGTQIPLLVMYSRSSKWSLLNSLTFTLQELWHLYTVYLEIFTAHSFHKGILWNFMMWDFMCILQSYLLIFSVVFTYTVC